MRIKRVDAPTVSEALRLLRQELGDSALILHTKTVSGSGVSGLFRRPRVEILGAVDEPGLPPPFAAERPATATPVAPAPVHAALGVPEDPSSAQERRGAIAERLARFRAAVPAIPFAEMRPLAPPTTADASVGGITTRASDWDRVGHRPRRIAFVGPTGAGKTTTLAKVAARARLEHKRRVSLVTIDTYRIGAVPQLASYAEILGVPLAVAQTPDELARAIDGAKDADLIFIDTIGRSPLGGGVDTLRPFMEAAAADVVHLVLSATTRPSDSIRAAASFSAVAPNRLCITKLDETEDRGAIPVVSDAVKLPITWLGTGQDVPDDLEEATPARMAVLVPVCAA